MAQQQQQQHQHQHQQLLSGMWPWSGHRPEDTDDSWEVRTFSTEDTKSSYLTTWPPRSYTCSFCRREFRSAQALGGHMNVHRRDRAKLHQSSVVSNPSSPPPLVISNGGMRLFYPLRPVPSDAVFAPAPSTVLSMSPCSTTGTDPVASLNESPGKSDSSASSTSTEELDLELRLGW